jgi:hypothetical protein
VQFVYEDDDAALVEGNLLEYRLQALLELSSIPFDFVELKTSFWGPKGLFCGGSGARSPREDFGTLPPTKLKLNAAF